MLYVKKDRIKDLEKYGFKRDSGTWYLMAASNAFGTESEVAVEFIVNPFENKIVRTTGDYRLIVDAYAYVDKYDVDVHFGKSVEEEESASLDVIYDMIADGLIEKR